MEPRLSKNGDIRIDFHAFRENTVPTFPILIILYYTEENEPANTIWKQIQHLYVVSTEQ